MSRKPYSGTQRKLVLAFDVGTTFSGISYTVLAPGEVPKILGVNRFPAQENVGGDSKIPTVIYYDTSGKPRAFGAETLDPRNVILADEEGWKKVEWFKMHLRPKSMGSTVDGTKIPLLPTGKTIVDVFADFLRYLFNCARTWISESHAAGDVLWRSLVGSIHFILTHPNGWQGPQQTIMRKSAILAGLVPDTSEGHSRIQFVTEGEASLHFCIRSKLSGDSVKPGNNVIIADAGGGTIDVSSYRFSSTNPVRVKESAVPDCKAQGAIFVTRRAHEHFKKLLSGSKYGTPEEVDAIAEVFDKTAKHIFRDDTEPSYVKFGGPRDKDVQFGIRSGQLKLEGSLVARFFEKSIQSLVDAIKSQHTGGSHSGLRNANTASVTPVFLVGGFAASHWLFSQLQTRLARSGFSVYRPDTHTNKAVADGAISFHVDHFVTERVARTTLGVDLQTPFNIGQPEHRRRRATKILDISGKPLLPNSFCTLITKGTSVSETTEFRQSYYQQAFTKDQLSFQNLSVLSYVGNRDEPKWTDEEPDDYTNYCTVYADFSTMTKTLPPLRSRTGKTYFEASGEIVLLFGLTETEAFLTWKENGVEKRGPATIIYDTMAAEDEDQDSDIEEHPPAYLSGWRRALDEGSSGW